MINQTDAFLSYTRIDDQFFGGSITSLRKFLELGVQVVTGRSDFNIFQDIDGIEFGQQWQKRLDHAIVSTRFLIPIVTPLFFQSHACRGELKKFIEHENGLGRDDLILPVYFVTAPVLEKADLLSADPLASAISARQRYDWRSKADLPINDPQIRSAVIDLSQKIAAAISRTETASSSSEIAPRGPSIKVAPPSASASAFSAASEIVKNQEPLRENRDQRKILWVDDRPENNIFERRAMKSYNIDFELAESTGEALAMLRTAKFDAIISDMGRPPDMQAGYPVNARDELSSGNTPSPAACNGEPRHQCRSCRVSRE